MRSWNSRVSLGLAAIGLLGGLLSCAENQTRQETPPPEPVRVYLSENSNAARYKGTFSQVQHVQLEAYDSSDQLADNLSLTRENNVWFGTLDNLTVNTTYDFHAYAYDNLTVQNNDTLLFSGQTLQPISSGDNVLQIRMNPVALSGATATDIPRITRIYYPSAIAPNGSAEIRVEVEAGINDALTWEVDNATLCGSVSPSSGSYSVASIASSFSFTYTDTSACAGEINLPITVRNAELGYAMTSRVSLTISNATEIQPNVLFNPVVLQLKGEPENNGNDIRWSAIVTDDGQASNLSATWSFLGKAFSDNLTSPSGDNVTFSTLMSSYSPDDNGTLSLQLLGSEGDNLTVSWNIEKNQFSSVVQVNSASRFEQLISTGETHSCYIDDQISGTVRCWGNNTYGQLGTGDNSSFTRPVAVSGLSGATSVAVGANHSCALLNTGEVRCWGNNNSSQVDGYLTSYYTTFVELNSTLNAKYIDSGILGNAVQITAGSTFSCVLIDSGEIDCWGTISGTSTPTSNNFVQIEAGTEHACAVSDNGSVTCWGNDTASSGKISQASGITQAVQVSAGDNHTCAVIDNGSVACWGDNTYGQLGAGDTAVHASPVYPNIDEVVWVSAGKQHTCATRANGTIRCWGNNANAQLGNQVAGGTINEPGFVQGGVNNAYQIAAGGTHTCLLKENYDLACWGDNSYGQAGFGATTSAYFPKEVVVDRVAPSSLTVTPTSTIFGTSVVSLRIEATDDLEIVEYRIHNSQNGWSDWFTFGSPSSNINETISYDTGLSDGTYSFNLDIRDSGGNTYESTSIGSLTIDISSPSVSAYCSSCTDQGNYYSNSTNITIYVSAETNVSYYISESGTAPTTGDWIDNGTFTLSSYAYIPFDVSAGDGTKNLYVWVKDQFDRETSYTTSLILDASGPVLVDNLTVDGGAFYTTDSSVNTQFWLPILDNISYKIYGDSGYTYPVGYSYTDYSYTDYVDVDSNTIFNSASNGLKTITVQAADYANNLSDNISTTITMAYPSGSEVQITPNYTNNSHEFVDSQTVQVKLLAPQNTGTTFTHVYLNETTASPPDNNSVGWIDYTDNMTTSYTFTAATSGYPSLYTWFKDSNGYVAGSSPYSTESYSDSIYMDLDNTTNPVVNSVTINSSSAVAINVTDLGIVVEAFVSDNNTTPNNSSNWQSVAPAANYANTSVSAPYTSNILSNGLNINDNETIYAWVRDSKGNISNAGSDNYTVYNFNTSSPVSFTASGTTGWAESSTRTYNGSHSLKSGAISTNQTSCTATTASNDGYVSFRYLVYSESPDRLFFYVDGNENENSVASFNGQSSASNWYSYNYPVSAGQEIKFCYEKDGSIDYYDDAAYIDQLIIP